MFGRALIGVRVQVAIATLIALVLGTLRAVAAVERFRALRAARSYRFIILPIPFLAGSSNCTSSRSASAPWTSVLNVDDRAGDATFCVVYNNAVALFRRTSGSSIAASDDLGADGFNLPPRPVPPIGTALLAEDAGLCAVLRRGRSSPPSRLVGTDTADLDAGRTGAATSAAVTTWWSWSRS